MIHTNFDFKQEKLRRNHITFSYTEVKNSNQGFLLTGE